MGLMVLVTIAGATSVFATHDRGVEDFEWHVWSRSIDDGHLGHLNCDSSNDYCALKIKTTGSIQGLAQSVINDEVDSVEEHFDSLGKKMSIDRTLTADSVITASNLKYQESGRSDYDLHCTQYNWFFFWICDKHDDHFVKMTVKLNDNVADVKFALLENKNADPKEFDIRKVLGHELYHAMGIDHNPASGSIVFYQYEFGDDLGYEATAADVADLEKRYP